VLELHFGAHACDLAGCVRLPAVVAAHVDNHCKGFFSEMFFSK
jgi:hypothetical protein